MSDDSDVREIVVELHGLVEDLKRQVFDLAVVVGKKSQCSFSIVPHVPEHTVHRDPLAVMKALQEAGL
jgi:hypothetical protein